MDPFNKDVWEYLGLAFIGVSLSFFILGRLSPTEWDNPCPCIEEPTELENQFTLSNSLWFTTGALLQQGSEIAHFRALSVRTMASIWWFFTLIMVSSYTANLAAFLTIETQSKKEQGDANPLNMKNLEGIYWVLVFGSGMALIHGIISWICFVLHKARSHRVPLKAAFKEEFKFVLEFTTYTRELKNSASIYSRSRNSSINIEELDADINTIDN